MGFTVAIIGRPNVGKSTLFNRLTGKRQALTDDTPGVTRDRRQGNAELSDLKFTIIDTAGLEEAKEGSLQARMTDQTKTAAVDADVVLMMIDGRAGITPMDRHFADFIRRTEKPVVLVVNKAETNKAVGAAMSEAFSLGLGDPVAISAEHGEGLTDLYDALLPFDKEADEEKQKDIALRIAIVGRPNVGKSTLFNRIIGEERTLTGPEAGITRDAIMVNFTHEGHAFQLVDTAGMRRKANVVDKIEKMAVGDSLTAIQFAQIVVVVLDANQPLEKQDNAIAAIVEQEGRAAVIAVNKWDSIAEQDKYLKAIHQRIDKVLPQLRGVQVVPISAERGYGIDKLLKACLKAHALWNREISTSKLNRWLEATMQAYTPPLIDGRRLKIRYMTQKSARPPSFILFANLSEIPDSYMRYLINSMREQFDLPGVPIRIKVKRSANPYKSSKS